MRIEAGRYKGRTLPTAHDARPVPGRLRRSLFSVLAPRLEGARVLDLYAGVGGMGLEALSRGAARVVLLDRDRRAVDALNRWIQAANATDEARAVRQDVLRQALPDGPFDLVLVDPPFDLWDDEASASRLLARAVGVVAADGWVVLKVPKALQVPAGSLWRQVRRRAAGNTAWVLLEAAEEGSSGAPDGPMVA